MGATVELPALFCPGTGCGWQLVPPLFVDADRRLLCVWCAQKTPAAVRPVTVEAAGWVPGAGPVLDPHDAVRLLLSHGGRLHAIEPGHGGRYGTPQVEHGQR